MSPRILSVTGILPIPGYTQINDFLLHLFQSYIKLYPSATVTFLIPRKRRLFNKLDKKILALKKFNLEGFEVHILPYITTVQKFRNLYVLGCHSFYLLNRRKIHRIIAEKDINIIHSEFIFPDGMLAKKLKKKFRIPYIITSHNDRKYLEKPVSKALAKSILKNSDFVTPVNHFSRNLYINLGIESSKIFVTAHGIDSKFFNYNHIPGTDGTIRIITIAALIKLKNIDKVIEAIAQIDPKIPLEYKIIGKGPEKENIINLIDKHDLNKNVKIVDKVAYDKIPEVLSESDIFVMPSFFETFGRVYFEAMAVGIPVICAKNTGIHGYFIDDDEVIAVNHENQNEINEALNKLVTNRELRLQMGEKAKKLMHNFTWDKIAQKLHELYLSSIRK